jgi:hypothetical protein
MIGVFRYVRHHDLVFRLAEGWKWCADLGDIHGEWSCLMWWCNGSCLEDEAP